MRGSVDPGAESEEETAMVGAGGLTSSGSNEGRLDALGLAGLSGVRKGDLNGLWSVLLASLRRRRFACGVDIVLPVWFWQHPAQKRREGRAVVQAATAVVNAPAR